MRKRYHHIPARVNLCGISDSGDFFNRIRKALSIPSYYEDNWQDISDFIKTGCVATHITVEADGLSDKSVIEKLENILKETELYWRESSYPFNYEIIKKKGLSHKDAEFVFFVPKMYKGTSSGQKKQIKSKIL